LQKVHERATPTKRTCSPWIWKGKKGSHTPLYLKSWRRFSKAGRREPGANSRIIMNKGNLQKERESLGEGILEESLALGPIWGRFSHLATSRGILSREGILATPLAKQGTEKLAKERIAILRIERSPLFKTWNGPQQSSHI